MNTSNLGTAAALAILCVAAILEAGGDALVRTGLHSPGLKRVVFMLIGGLVLAVYGVAVNAPAWDFGRLLGIYVVLFFLVAQLINFFFFHQKPGLPIVVGGALITAGGIVITAWRN